MDNREQIIKKLQQIRKELALTQNEFANQLGMNRSYLCRIENGTQNASPNFLSKVCVAFNIPLNYFDEDVPISENITNKNRNLPIYNPNSSMYVNSAHRTLDTIFEYRGNDNKEFQKDMMTYTNNVMSQEDILAVIMTWDNSQSKVNKKCLKTIKKDLCARQDYINHT